MVFGELSPPGVVPTPGVLQAAQQPAANPPQEAAPGAKVEEAERSEVSTLRGPEGRPLCEGGAGSRVEGCSAFCMAVTDRRQLRCEAARCPPDPKDCGGPGRPPPLPPGGSSVLVAP